MKEYSIGKIRKTIKKKQDKKRYEHTLGVACTAVALAMCYGIPLKQAETAGLLHDCAKCISDDKLIAICDKHDIEVTDSERKSPFLLHAKAGGYLAKKKYGIKDPDIINSIKHHTTGRPGMSLLEKIIFVADYIEPGRKNAPNLDEARRMSFKDIDCAMEMILRDILVYLESTGDEIDPMTGITYEYYRDLKKEDQNE